MMSGAALRGLSVDPPRKRMTLSRSTMQTSNVTPIRPSAAAEEPETETSTVATASQDGAATATAETGSPAPAPPPVPGSDADILARAQGGDHYAFAQLYSMHKRRIYSLCLRMV